METDLPYVKIQYQKPIVYFYYKNGSVLGFPEIRELISHAEKMSGNRPYVTFSDVTVDLEITHEGQKFLSDYKNMPLFRGSAVLVKNSMYKHAINFANNFKKHPYPIKAFTDKKKAEAWLKTLIFDIGR